MAEPWTDERLAAVLADVGEHLDTSSPCASDADGATPARRTRRVLAVAAAVTLLALVVGSLVAPVREAVADWLGIGSTRVERVPPGDRRSDPAGLPALDDDLAVLSADEAEAALGHPLPDVDDVGGLGPPDRVVGAPEGGAILAWDRGDTTLWVHEVPEDPEVGRQKLATMTSRVETVEGLGDAALSLEGTHVLTTPGRRLAAANVVIWTEDGFEHRLESGRPVDEIVRMARAVER
jgi:hypothetical protein